MEKHHIVYDGENKGAAQIAVLDSFFSLAQPQDNIVHEVLYPDNRELGKKFRDRFDNKYHSTMSAAVKQTSRVFLTSPEPKTHKQRQRGSGFIDRHLFLRVGQIASSSSRRIYVCSSDSDFIGIDSLLEHRVTFLGTRQLQQISQCMRDFRRGQVGAAGVRGLLRRIRAEN